MKLRQFENHLKPVGMQEKAMEILMTGKINFMNVKNICTYGW